MSEGLGRRIPLNFDHVGRFPLTVNPLAALMPPVEKILKLPYLARTSKHDQGSEGACVGFGMSLMMSILNTSQVGNFHWYDQRWLWNRSKEIDWWPDTNPGDSNGTSLDAACNILRTLGHVRIKRGHHGQPDVMQGIKENRWAKSVDDMRAVIGVGIPIGIGVNWYSGFDNPIQRLDKGRTGYWLPESGQEGSVRGGHCVCIYGASDRREAFRVANSWGKSYPLVWLPYSMMERLIHEDGEVALVTDL